jgi:hypothetical protein
VAVTTGSTTAADVTTGATEWINGLADTQAKAKTTIVNCNNKIKESIEFQENSKEKPLTILYILI